MSDQYRELIMEQRNTIIRQANALREVAKALEAQAATMLKLAGIDNVKDARYNSSHGR